MRLNPCLLLLLSPPLLHQGDDPELTWTLSLILTWARLLYGIVTALASLLWIANFALFLIPRTPIFFVMNYLISFRDSEKSFGAYILNCLDLVFLAFMTLYLVICATSGAMYLKDRIEVFKVMPCLLYTLQQPSKDKTVPLSVARVATTA